MLNHNRLVKAVIAGFVKIHGHSVSSEYAKHFAAEMAGEVSEFCLFEAILWQIDKIQGTCCYCIAAAINCDDGDSCGCEPISGFRGAIDASL